MANVDLSAGMVVRTSEPVIVKEARSCLPEADAAFPEPCGTASVACAES